jgi:hypothetical protein
MKKCYNPRIMKRYLLPAVLVASFFQVSTAKNIVIELPVRAADVQQNAFGMIPFGVHNAANPDGQPCYVIEFKPNSYITASANGTVQSVSPDLDNPGRSIVQLSHIYDLNKYITTYSNIKELAPGIRPGMPVQAGQSLGIVGTQAVTIKGMQYAYASSNFRLEDAQVTPGEVILPVPYAVDPNDYLSAAGKVSLQTLYQGARYDEQLTEPYLKNPRVIPDPINASNPTPDSKLPLVRTWTMMSGSHAAKIRFTREPKVSPPVYKYELLDVMENVLESGKATVSSLDFDYPAIDMKPSNNIVPRLGLYQVKSGVLRINYSQPGFPRPNNLNSASSYSTNYQ